MKIIEGKKDVLSICILQIVMSPGKLSNLIFYRVILGIK